MAVKDTLRRPGGWTGWLTPRRQARSPAGSTRRRLRSHRWMLPCGPLRPSRLEASPMTHSILSPYRSWYEMRTVTHPSFPHYSVGDFVGHVCGSPGVVYLNSVYASVLDRLIVLSVGLSSRQYNNNNTLNKRYINTRVGQSEVIGKSVDWPHDRRYDAPRPTDEDYAEMGCGCGI